MYRDLSEHKFNNLFLSINNIIKKKKNYQLILFRRKCLTINSTGNKKTLNHLDDVCVQIYIFFYQISFINVRILCVHIYESNL